MALINNESVRVGDRVYDIVHGYGQVLDTSFNNIVVRFDGGIRVAYDKYGYYGGKRRLYWHNPIVVEPTKDDKLWQVMHECLLSIQRYLESKD